jgi:uncharacterized protein
MNSFPFDISLLVKICLDAGVEKIGIFGSMARGDCNAESDIDVLVKFPNDRPIGLFRMAHLKNELSTALGREVDLATDAQIGPDIRDTILHEIIYIYGA